MRRLLLLAPLLLLSAPANAQPDRANLYSNPRLPTGEALERLHLKMAWSARVPTEGRRDGFVGISLAPIREAGKTTFHLIVQTRSGLVAEMDAETGQTFWRTRVGNLNTTDQPVGFNNNDIIALRGQDVFALDRKNGDVRWKFQPGAIALGQPLVDPSQFYLNLGSTEVVAYHLPTQQEGKPITHQNHRAQIPLQLAASQLERFLVYPSPRGSVVILSKENMGEFLRYRTEGELGAGPGVHEVESGVYIGSRDTNLYGYTVLQGELPWRLPTGGPIERTPFVNNEDVFVTAERVGLLRVHRRIMSGADMNRMLEKRGLATQPQLKEVFDELGRKKADDPTAILSLLLQKGYITQKQKDGVRYRGGDAAWTVPDGDRMLAVNPKFVYAMDGTGRLLVIDRERGRILSRFDLRDYPVAISNELTDRIYLAAHDGLIVCLHDRDFATPVRMKALLEPQPPGKPSAPGGMAGEGGMPK